MVVNQSKSTITKNTVSKGKTGVTWNEATFTWDQGVNSTWDSVGAITVGNQTKSSVTKNTVNKSTIT